MKQKFLIQKVAKNNDLSIKEYANLEREHKNNVLNSTQEAFSLLCEETYDTQRMLCAIEKGKKDLVAAIRTHNMYPILVHAEKIADSVIELYHTEENLSVELLFDDKELLERIKPVKIAS